MRRALLTHLCVVVLGAFALTYAPHNSASALGASLELIWIGENGSELERREMSISDTEELAVSEIRTRTPWTQGVSSYTGPTLARLSALGEKAVVEARLQALNDYSITVPSEDWANYDVVLATRVDGERMRIRDRGPFWLIYPLDSDEELQTQRYHARMIWQVKRIYFVVDDK